MYGPKWPFLLKYMSFDVDVGTYGSWVELPAQRRLCPIFMNSVGLPDITSILRVDGLSTDPRFWGVTAWYQSLGTRIPRALGLGLRS